jgi:hypothetical protein
MYAGGAPFIGYMQVLSCVTDVDSASITHELSPDMATTMSLLRSRVQTNACSRPQNDISFTDTMGAMSLEAESAVGKSSHVGDMDRWDGLPGVPRNRITNREMPPRTSKLVCATQTTASSYTDLYKVPD